MDIDLDLQNVVQSASVPASARISHWLAVAIEQAASACRAGALRSVTRPVPDKAAQLTVRVVDSTESAQLNSDYRHRPGATNVLSFPFDAPVLLEPPLLGDIVICEEKVQQEAGEQGKSIDVHRAHLLVHGVLHLLGFDHEKDDEAESMECLERNIMAALGFPDPYEEVPVAGKQDVGDQDAAGSGRVRIK